VIPLRNFAWISTTDTDFEDDPTDVNSTPEDVEYLLRSAGAFVPEYEHAPVYWTNAGVRALVMQEGSESSVSRAHKIESTPGLVSVLGGKITGYRAIAEEATDAVAKQLGVGRTSTTAERKLPGGRSPGEEQVVHLADYMMRRTSLSFTPDQGRGVMEETALKLAAELGWDAVQIRSELRSYLDELGKTYTPAIHSN
jgi:glycerol-3-phosphate dehydrogenase